ncbi:MAG: DUF1722 domain-containing protein [Anaerolineae bacterium]|nr:DUF1722 domain-containing protein [Anaerolineae bacterium]
MRVWDIHPGYLNRQSLLGEHRELHGIVSIIVNGKKGYANHPETLRWVGYDWALRQRHRLLACEMALRGFTDKSPVTTHSNAGLWPEIYLDTPARQFELLADKYVDREAGRIPLPKNLPQLWQQHKYSVLARNPQLYQKIGQDVARKQWAFSDLALLLTTILREQPTEGGIRNVVQHMWGYVSEGSLENQGIIARWSVRELLIETQTRAMASKVSYLIASTALSELLVWLPEA